MYGVVRGLIDWLMDTSLGPMITGGLVILIAFSAVSTLAGADGADGGEAD